MDKYQELKKSGKLCGTVPQARLIRRERDNVHTEISLKEMAGQPSQVIIPLGAVYAAHVIRTARAMQPRIRKWSEPTPRADITIKVCRVDTVQTCRYGRVLYVRNVTHVPRIRSFGLITRRRLCWYIGTRHEVWVARRGWHFGITKCPATGNWRIYACMNKYEERDLEMRVWFTADDMYSEEEFWDSCRARVSHVLWRRKCNREYKRVTSTVITVELHLRHNGKPMVVRLQRTGPMCWPPR